MVQLNANRMGWHVAAGCYGSHAGSVCLQFWINPQQCHQQPHTITPPPCFTMGTRHAESICSPFLCRTKTQWLELKISNLDSSDQSTDFHWSNVHSLCFLAQTNLFCLLPLLSSGFLAAIWPRRPDSRSLLLTVVLEMCLLKWKPFQVTTWWSPLREHQGFAALSKKQRVATLRNLKYKTYLSYFTLFC